jgi:predicted HD superfamily hydrolase involved in NAD metabolism
MHAFNKAPMNDYLMPFLQSIPLTDDIRTDMITLLTHHGCVKTVGHSIRVAAESVRLARRWGVDEMSAEVAGLLYDISAIVPNEQRVALAERLGIEVLPEERAFPMIIHQKLSAVIARDVFGVANEPVLSAIGCHTTLKADASALDKVVFVADKIKWDQPGEPPYLPELLIAAEESLDAAAFCYLDYLWRRRDTLRVVHPWLIAAHMELARY